MKYTSIFLPLFFCFISCVDSSFDQYTKGLRKLSHSEMLERAKWGDIPDTKGFSYLSEEGEIISIDSFRNISPENFKNIGFDDYVDENGFVKIIVLRSIKNDDRNFLEKEQLAIDEGPDLILRDINCDSLSHTLEYIGRIDQKNRKIIENYSRRVDYENLEIILSAINHCNLIENYDNLSHKDVQSIWLVIQHAPNKYMEEFFPFFISLSDSGKLDIRDLFTMKDRIMVEKGLPQIYGTQICYDKFNSPMLCEVEDPKNLDSRRDSIGFQKINDYLSNWGLSFDPSYY